MARVKHKGIYHPKVAPPGAADPDSLWAYAIRFTHWQAERNYSSHTIEARERTLRTFAAWAAERGLVRPADVTKPILERWQRHLLGSAPLQDETVPARSHRPWSCGAGLTGR